MTFEPCIGCGMCCKTQCLTGQWTYGEHNRCPGLVWEGARYECRLISAAVLEGNSARLDDMAVGGGCGSTLFNSWRLAIKELQSAKVEEEVYLTLVDIVNQTAWRRS